ncbi:hypothetical protein CHUAL_000315 [Chamberlinius hualienensis]
MTQESDSYKIPNSYLRKLTIFQCHSPMNRKKCFFFAFITSILTFLIVYSTVPVNYLNITLSSQVISKETSFEIDDGKITRYTINTPGCQIPYLNPMDWSVLPYITPDLPPLPCGLHVKQMSSIEHQHLVMNFSSVKEFSQLPIDQFPVSCCYEGITRNISFVPDTDDFVT